MSGTKPPWLTPSGEHQATISQVELRLYNRRKSRNSRQGKTTTEWFLHVTFSLLTHEMRNVRRSYRLDVSADGSIDFSEGKNGELKRLCEAAGQLSPSTGWSPYQLRGVGPLRVHIAPQLVKGSRDVVVLVVQVMDHDPVKVWRALEAFKRLEIDLEELERELIEAGLSRDGAWLRIKRAIPVLIDYDPDKKDWAFPDVDKQEIKDTMSMLSDMGIIEREDGGPLADQKGTATHPPNDKPKAAGN